MGEGERGLRIQGSGVKLRVKNVNVMKERINVNKRALIKPGKIETRQRENEDN